MASPRRHQTYAWSANPVRSDLARRSRLAPLTQPRATTAPKKSPRETEPVKQDDKMHCIEHLEKPLMALIQWRRPLWGTSGRITGASQDVIAAFFVELRRRPLYYSFVHGLLILNTASQLQKRPLAGINELQVKRVRLVLFSLWNVLPWTGSGLCLKTCTRPPSSQHQCLSIPFSFSTEFTYRLRVYMKT